MSLQQLHETLKQQTRALNESTAHIVSLKDQLAETNQALTAALRPVQPVLYSERLPVKQYVPNRLWLATSIGLIVAGVTFWIW